MYCMNCGVHLADSEEVCPLCHLAVYHPKLDHKIGVKPYPQQEKERERVNPLLTAVVLTVLFAMAAVFTFVCNIGVSHNVNWFKYVGISLAMLYIWFVLPLWFSRFYPLIFLPIDVAAAEAFLLFINLFTHGHWFLSFAFPVLGGVGLILCAVVYLTHFLKRARVLIYGGATVALGCFMLLVEFFLCMTFAMPPLFSWSLYALTALCIIGGILLLIGLVKPLRDSLEKRFFL